MADFTFSEGLSIYKTFKPAAKNLFTVVITLSDNTDLDLGGKSFGAKEIASYTKLHATAITIGDESLSLKRNELSKQFQADGNESYKRADTLKITWRESSDWEVRRYHEAWINTIYDKEKDVYRSKPAGNPYRKLIIYLPDDYSITCEGILPKNIGSIDLAWGKGSSVITPTLEYYVARVNTIGKSK